MKFFALLYLFIAASILTQAQPYPFDVQKVFPDRDSLFAVIRQPQNDLELVKAYREMGFSYYESKRDSAQYYYEQILILARRNNWKLWEADVSNSIAFGAYILGNFPQALLFLQTAKAIAENPESEKSPGLPEGADPHLARLRILQRTYNHFASLYAFAGNFKDFNSLEFYYFGEAFKINTEIRDTGFRSILAQNMGRHYARIGNIDSTIYWETEALRNADASKYFRYKGVMLKIMGDAYFKKEVFQQARLLYWQSVDVSRSLDNLRSLGDAYLALANLCRKTNELDSSISYGKQAIESFVSTNVRMTLVDTYLSLSETYALRHNIDSAFKYQGLAIEIRDEVNTAEKLKQFQNLKFDEVLKLEQAEQEKTRLQNRIKINALLGFLATFVLVAFLLLRNNRQRQKANTLLQQQKEELANTLAELKTTQAQLIQSEKMASLGELTAGIAHEIQNPLNFVNNFSELNQELINDLHDELQRGNVNEALTLADDIKENETKIYHHGKRADTIVKAMLQHSHNSRGAKEPTDINAMVDEYLRLAFHGMRTKEKDFQAAFSTTLDESIGRVNIVQQDIGRVLLNLINNAFYSVNEKSKMGIPGYQPSVHITTVKNGDKIIIQVKDNGIGIPSSITSKILQPFFTTKPAGQGTGLGLSLSYDIIKSQGGELTFQSVEGEGAEFNVAI